MGWLRLNADQFVFTRQLDGGKRSGAEPAPPTRAKRHHNKSMAGACHGVEQRYPVEHMLSVRRQAGRLKSFTIVNLKVFGRKRPDIHACSNTEKIGPISGGRYTGPGGE